MCVPLKTSSFLVFQIAWAAVANVVGQPDLLCSLRRFRDIQVLAAPSKKSSLFTGSSFSQTSFVSGQSRMQCVMSSVLSEHLGQAGLWVKALLQHSWLVHNLPHLRSNINTLVRCGICSFHMVDQGPTLGWSWPHLAMLYAERKEKPPSGEGHHIHLSGPAWEKGGGMSRMVRATSLGSQ